MKYKWRLISTKLYLLYKSGNQTTRRDRSKDFLKSNIPHKEEYKSAPNLEIKETDLLVLIGLGTLRFTCANRLNV